MGATKTLRKSAGTLIVGAGQAGVQLASSLRELGDTSPITIVGDEAHPPYQRPPLSKAFLSGSMSEGELAFRGAEFYTANDITLVCGERVESITLDSDAGGSGQAVTRTDRLLTFERLAFTVGGAPRRLRVPGADLEGVHYLRTVDDAVSLRSDLARAARVAIIGGGFVGLEIAATATANGKDVTVLEAQDRLMGRVVAPVMSRFYMDAHQRRGTHIMLSASVTGIRGDARVSGVELADGRVIGADVVVVGIGLVPRTDLAAALGLADDRGIVVDAHGRTRIPGVVAAGDCTVSAHSVHGAVRLESVPHAIAQAKTAAAALLEREPSAVPVPWFWSDQGDLKLQMAGLTLGYDRVILRGEPASERFSALYYRAGRFASIEAVNAPSDYMSARRILEIGGDVPPEAAADTTIPLKVHLSM